MWKINYFIFCHCGNKQQSCYIGKNNKMFLQACKSNNFTDIYVLGDLVGTINKYLKAENLSNEYIEKLLLLI